MATAEIDRAARLTPRQAEIVGFIREATRSKGYGPSVREIGARFGIRSPNGVLCHLKALQKKGAIRRGVNVSRSIVLVDEPADSPTAAAGPDEAARVLRVLADLATRLPRGHGQAPCTHAIYLTDDELATLERHAAPPERV